MAAAWELSHPKHNGRFKITVYQEGWRLGGKGSSGRGPSGRIEEHGLHIWLGFYDNAFRMMRECHAELAQQGLGDLYGDWTDAWTPENDVALFSAAEDGGFQKWNVHMPPRPGLPGDPETRGEVFTLRYYLIRACDLFRTLLLDTTVDGQGVGPRRGADGSVDALASLTYLLRLGTFSGAAAVAQGLGLLATLFGSTAATESAAVTEAAESVFAKLRLWIEDRWLADNEHRFLWEVADLTLATMVGLVRHGVWTDQRGLDAIDDYECREWLHMNGASLRAIQSPFLRGLYDLSMGYEDGDPEKPCLSAGQGLRGTLRTFFGYRGAFMWRMRAGMGDVVFAPLYTALLRRGVEFKFFHRLKNVGLPPTPPEPGAADYVRSLTFEVQAKTKRDARKNKPLAYDPLVGVAGRPCWPAAPRFDQLVDGARIKAEGWDLESHWDRRHAERVTLKVGKHFDFVVLGVGLGAVPHVCPELVERNPRWKAMTQNVKTVASQAFQIWLSEDLESLGWQGPAYITGAFAKPFDTWCDMAHVVPEEGWAQPPKTCVYFCAALRDPPSQPDDDDRSYPARRTLEVRRSAETFLRDEIGHVWPLAIGPDGDFRWDILTTDPDTPGAASRGRDRFGTQYWRANVNPSDRYVIHTPGSFRSRISPLDMDYDNLTIAGDWTDSGFHSGCVEGAVMSGRLAAHALCGEPKLKDIIGYDHP